MAVTTDWLIGFFLGLATRLLNAVAVQSYARAHRQIEKKHAEAQLSESASKLSDRPRYVCDRCWLLGLSCSIVSGVTDVLSLGYAPAALIAPMGSLTLIFNLCLNPLINREPVSRYTVGVTLLICSGTVLTVVFSPRGDENEGSDIGKELADIYISWYFAIFAMAIAALLCSLWAATIRWSNDSTVYSVAVPALSGTLSAVNRTIGKGMAIGLKLTFRGDGCFCVEWLWYIVFVGIFLSLFAHLKWLNRGLAAFSPVLIIPINSTCSMLITTTAGLVVFREWNQFNSELSVIMFACGILVIVAGMIAITKSPDSPTTIKTVQTDIAMGTPYITSTHNSTVNSPKIQHQPLEIISIPELRAESDELCLDLDLPSTDEIAEEMEMYPRITD